MHPNTRYHLEEYLRQKKKLDAEKPPREPSGFMRKHKNREPEVTPRKPARSAGR